MKKIIIAGAIALFSASAYADCEVQNEELLLLQRQLADVEAEIVKAKADFEADKVKNTSLDKEITKLKKNLKQVKFDIGNTKHRARNNGFEL